MSRATTKNTSVNLEFEVFDWLDEESEKRGVNRSKLINEIVRDRMGTRPSGLRHDVEWILDNKLNDFLKYKQLDYNEELWGASYVIYRDLSPIEEPDCPVCFIMVAELTRNRLRELFAEAMILSLEDEDVPTIMLIPYKTDPSNKIWKAFSKQELLSVKTPENFLSIVHNSWSKFLSENGRNLKVHHEACLKKEIEEAEANA